MPREVSGQSNSYFVKRSSRTGRFKKFTRKGKSLAADRLHKAENHPTKPGYGDVGDYEKK